MFEEEGLVRVERFPDDDGYATIERTEECACTARDGLAVRGSAVVCREDLAIVGHTAFRLPIYDEDCLETQTALLWLLCNHFRFYTFSTRIENGTLRRGLIEAIEQLFVRRTRPSCECVEYVFRDNVKPLYCLRHIVLTNEKKGPTIESVL